jgi:hypothetical protein
MLPCVSAALAATDEASVPRPTPNPRAAAGDQKPAAAPRTNGRAKDDLVTPGKADTRSGQSAKDEPQPRPPFDREAAKACEGELTKRGVAFKVMDEIREANGCGAERPLSIASLGEGVALEGGVTARCEVVLALDTWMRHTVQPSAKLHLGSSVKAIGIGSHYECRGRNGDPDAKLSEHAFANGVDIATFKLDGKPDVAMAIRDGSAEPERAFQAAVRAAACAYFTTVLGPGTDSAHAEHLHFDLATRKNGYRLCQ